MTGPEDADARADELFRRLARQHAVPLPPPAGTWQQIRAESRRRRHRRHGVLLAAAACLLVVLAGAAVTVGLRPGARTDRLVQAGPPSATSLSTPTPSRTPSPSPSTTHTPTTDGTPATAGEPSGPLPAPLPGSPSPSPSGSPSPSASAAPLRACRTDQLSVNAGQVQAMASTRSIVLGLTNVSPTRCTATGYGALRLVDAKGADLTTTEQRDAVPTARAIELVPQGHTIRTVSWRVVPDPPTTVADCISGTALRVTPPDNTRGLRLQRSITACDRGALNAGAWTRVAG
jgi:hypothetical protein